MGNRQVWWITITAGRLTQELLDCPVLEGMKTDHDQTAAGFKNTQSLWQH
jgi:hypothetical protein